jgi:hypothetical protein
MARAIEKRLRNNAQHQPLTAETRIGHRTFLHAMCMWQGEMPMQVAQQSCARLPLLKHDFSQVHRVNFSLQRFLD